MKNRLASWGCGSLLLLFLFSLYGCGRSADSSPLQVKLNGETMGTTYQVTIAGFEPGEQFKQLQGEIDQQLEELNRQMSTYQSDSEISRFSQSRELTWFDVSPEFAEVVAAALKIAEETSGAFDPTVAPLVNLWNFGPGVTEFKVPSDEQIEAARKNVGYQHLEVRQDPPAIRKKIPELQLDLSAIAKGYAVDRIGLILENKNFHDYLVVIGGEVRAKGSRLGSGTAAKSTPTDMSRLWRIAVEKPVEGRREIQGLVPLNDQSMATSGDYRNFYQVSDRKYSHTIHPATGRPVEQDLHSVSVIADTCMRADGLATALTVMGTESAWKFAQEHKIEILLIYGDQAELKTKQSDGFPFQPWGK